MNQMTNPRTLTKKRLKFIITPPAFKIKLDPRTTLINQRPYTMPFLLISQIIHILKDFKSFP
jgi:hypothetical protein